MIDPRSDTLPRSAQAVPDVTDAATAGAAFGDATIFGDPVASRRGITAATLSGKDDAFAMAAGPAKIRFVTHRQVTGDDVARTCAAVAATRAKLQERP